MSMLKDWVIPGAVAVALVTGISLWSETEKIEADLTMRANALIASKGMDWASVTIDGRDATLSGTEPEEGLSEWAVELLDAEWGIRVVEDRTSLLAEQSPYTWGLERADQKIAMIGYLPYDLHKSTPDMLRSAIAGANLSSSVEPARGAPQDMDKAVALASALIAKLPDAKVMLIDEQMTVSGQLEDGNEDHIALFATLQQTIDNSDLGAIAVHFQIAEPKAPVKDVAKEAADAIIDGFSIRHTGTGVELSGTLPSQDIKQTILDLAQRKFGAARVSQTLSVKEGEKIAGLGYEEYNKAVTAALQAVSRLGEGMALITSEGLIIEGGAFYDAALEQVKAVIASALPDGFALQSGLEVVAPGETVDAKACQALLRDALDQNTILFDSGQATISADSYGLLDALIYSALRCPEARIEIGGHTDSDGDDAANQLLSEKRAGAVVDYLIAAGLTPDRLEPKGFGEANPVADNGSAEGKAKNRRIEFVILAN